MNIVAIKLVTGEDVIGELQSESETEYVFENPVGISIVPGPNRQPQVGFSPFPLHAPQKKGNVLAILKKHVVYLYVPAEDFLQNYEQLFGSGIILPKKTLITE